MSKSHGANPELSQERGEQESAHLQQAIERNAAVRRLATNPLLLRILALIHRNQKHLPERRVELYRAASDTLLRKWQEEKGSSGTAVVDEIEEEYLLCPLAYWMHENEITGRIQIDTLRRLLREWHAPVEKLAPNHPTVSRFVKGFLQRLTQHSGLFVEHAPDKYGFLHPTFEEYFAARNMTRYGADTVMLLRQYRHKARWEEPIRLAIALQTPEEAARLIRAALWHKDGANTTTGYVPSAHEDVLRRDLLLTARCLGDCAAIEPTLAREIANELTDISLNRNDKGRYYPLRERVYETLPALANSEIGKEMQQQLLNALGDSYPRVKMRAIRALGRLEQSSETVVAALRNHLNDVEPDVWMSSALVLGQLGHSSDEVISALRVAFNNSDYSIRDQAAYTLGQLGRTSEAVMSTLLTAIKDNDNSVQRNAAIALGYSKQSSEAVISGLLEITHDGDWEVRRSAVVALGQIGETSDKVVSSLLEALKDPSQNVCMGAAYALGELGQASENVVNGLLTALRTNNYHKQMSAATALGQLKCRSADVTAALLESLSDPDEFVQRDAAAALGHLGDKSPEVISELRSLLQTEHSNVRATP